MSIIFRNNLIFKAGNNPRIIKFSFRGAKNIARKSKVVEKVNKIRNQAILGGGQKRIDEQHQKVSHINHSKKNYFN